MRADLPVRVEEDNYSRGYLWIEDWCEYVCGSFTEWFFGQLTPPATVGELWQAVQVPSWLSYILTVRLESHARDYETDEQVRWLIDFDAEHGIDYYDNTPRPEVADEFRRRFPLESIP